jgi:hypothetical protein
MMRMREYLDEIEHAASGTLRLVWSEHRQLEVLERKLGRLTKEIIDTNRRIEWLVANPDLDDDFQATAMHWDSYFGPEKELFHAEKSRPELETLVETRRFSSAAQSGSVLQYAKQGISLVHGGLASCPGGRMIGSQAIKTIIWQGRNQAMHWDEGRPKQPVQDCFDSLARDCGPEFGDYAGRNLAWEVVGLLGWRDFAAFEKDMLSLL